MSFFLRRGVMSSAALSGGTIYAASTANLTPASSQYFYIENLGAYTNFTFNFWVKPDNTSGSYKWVGIADGDNTELCWIGNGNAGDNTTIDYGVNTIGDNGIEAVSTGTWIMLSLVYDGTDAKLYKNGVQIGNDITSTFSITDLKIHIGKRAWAASGYFDGSIGFAGLYNTNLSASVLSTLYNSGDALCYGQLTVTQKTNLVSYWHLADFTGHTTDETTDQHGSNNLTNSGSTPFTGSGLSVEC